ncbi:MAG TPA: TAT-variant-translocated molybdopterin oxidoreductase [Candidatus Limnocylindrales bacterium]|nr:TAT-variant-translocated molybdopterin oxidoreductase [Candidatus Limnocylindrales bacterium]
MKDKGSKTPIPKVDLAAVRHKLDGVRGQDYWRSLEELAETEEFKQLVQREFPAGASEWWDGVSRRSFLKMAAATMALAGLSACTKQPVREIFPYVKQPEELVPGQPLYYATSMLWRGFATGVLAKSREGHPIKVDGNPQHPSTPSGSNVWLQASILDLYDPDRSQTVNYAGDISTWALFLSDLVELVKEQEAKKGAGLNFLTETVTSPTLTSQLDDLQRRFPEAHWCQYDPITRDNIRAGAEMAFGEFVETHYRFDKAAVILSLDSDFLYTHPEHLLYSRQFINGRRVSAGNKEMSRLYLVESSPTVTGSMADHRLPLESASIEDFTRTLAKQLGASIADTGTVLSSAQAQWLGALVKELQQHRGRSIVIAGEWQPPIVHALAHWLNQALGNTGNTVFYRDTAEASPINQLQSLHQLIERMRSGAVETLFILGGNPVYTAPVDLGFGELLRKVKRSIHLGMDLDETATQCTWHIPQTHYLESWGDARAFDGTVSLMQPLIAPLYDGKSVYELLGAMFQQQPIRTDYEIVHEYWRKQNPWPDFEDGWRRALHDGFLAGSQAPVKTVRVKSGFEKLSPRRQPPAKASIVVQSLSSAEESGDGIALFGSPALRRVRVENLEICFRPDPNLWDGRFANNGWLQECPKPLNKLTWDNAVLISPLVAERAGLQTGNVVELQLQGRKVRGPIWVMPGQAEESVTVHLGYGRWRVGRVGQNVGFNAYGLRSADAPWIGSGATLISTNQNHVLVATQTHHALHSPERQIYRATTLQQLRTQPDLVKNSVEVPEPDETLYDEEEHKYEGYQWGMSIDLTACIGCNACVVACEVENNVPVVGKEQVHKNREMLWLRIDTYYKGTLESPEFNHAPVLCMHCEHAPCELVCPVEAAVHDREGLNLQIYQRCVGTRFCSNNCPYKVRRFNFLRYTDYQTPSLKPMYNPEVTVRWRGVMEKCTYCVQRIAAARISAEKENRRIRDGEVQTACQQACPTDAIVFGDLTNPASKIVRLKRDPLDYPMLGQLNTRPRTTYLTKVQNPNADLEPAKGRVKYEKEIGSREFEGRTRAEGLKA